MMNKPFQKQEGGEQSTNVQGQSVNIYTGISYADAKEIALDVFKMNFLKLRDEVEMIARDRAEELIDNFLEKLLKINSDKITDLNQPGIWMVIFEAQKEYAQSGDSNVADLLVDLLIERVGEVERNVYQIVLNEALKVAPKLTENQLDFLTLKLLIEYEIFNTETFDDFKCDVRRKMLPFAPTVLDNKISFQYMEYLGCLTIRARLPILIKNEWIDKHSRVFSIGFTKEDFCDKLGIDIDLDELLMPCVFDDSMYQLKLTSSAQLMKWFEKRRLDIKLVNNIRRFLYESRKDYEQIEQRLKAVDPNFPLLIECLSPAKGPYFQLTPVGMVIANANLRRKIGFEVDLYELY